MWKHFIVLIFLSFSLHFSISKSTRYIPRNADRFAGSRKVKKLVQRLIKRQSIETPQAQPSQEYFSTNSLPYSSGSASSSYQQRNTGGSALSRHSSSGGRSRTSQAISFPDKIRYASLTDPASTSAPTRQPTTAQSSRNRNYNNRYSSSSLYRQESSSGISSYPPSSYSNSNYGSANRQPSYSNYQGQYHGSTSRQTYGSSSNTNSYNSDSGYSSNPSGTYGSYSNPYGSAGESNQRYYISGYSSNNNGQTSDISSSLPNTGAQYSLGYGSYSGQAGGSDISYQGSDIRVGSTSTRYDHTSAGRMSNAQSGSNYPYSGRMNQQGYQYSQMSNPYSAGSSMYNGNSYGGQGYRGYTGYSGSNMYGSESNSYGNSGSQYYSGRSSLGSLHPQTSQRSYGESQNNFNGYNGEQIYSSSNNYGGSDTSYGGYGSQQAQYSSSYRGSSLPQGSSVYSSSNTYSQYNPYGNSGSSSDAYYRNTGSATSGSSYGSYGGSSIYSSSSQEGAGGYFSNGMRSNSYRGYGANLGGTRLMSSQQNQDSTTEQQYGNADTQSNSYHGSSNTGMTGSRYSNTGYSAASHYYPNTNMQSSSEHNSMTSNSRFPSISSSLYPEYGRSSSYYGGSSDSTAIPSGRHGSFGNYYGPSPSTSSHLSGLYVGSGNQRGSFLGGSNSETSAIFSSLSGSSSLPSSRVYNATSNLQNERTYLSRIADRGHSNLQSPGSDQSAFYSSSERVSANVGYSNGQSSLYGSRSNPNTSPYQDQQHYYGSNHAVSSDRKPVASQPSPSGRPSFQDRQSSEIISTYYVSSEISSSRNINSQEGTSTNYGQNSYETRISLNPEESGSQSSAHRIPNSQDGTSFQIQHSYYGSPQQTSSNNRQSNQRSSVHETRNNQHIVSTENQENTHGLNGVSESSNAGSRYGWSSTTPSDISSNSSQLFINSLLSGASVSNNASSDYLPRGQQQYQTPETNEEDSRSLAQIYLYSTQNGASINSHYADRGSPYDSPTISERSQSSSFSQTINLQSRSQPQTSRQDSNQTSVSNTSQPSTSQQSYRNRGITSNNGSARSGTQSSARNRLRNRGSSHFYRPDNEISSSSLSSIYSLPSRSRGRQHYGSRHGSSPSIIRGRNSNGRGGRIHENAGGITVVEQGTSIYQAGYDENDDSDYNDDYDDNDVGREQDPTLPNQGQQNLGPANQTSSEQKNEVTSQTPYLPDLEINKYMLMTNFVLDRKDLSELECARGEGCLSSSANIHSSRFMPRKLLRFQTTVKNIGRAIFRPKLKKSDWIWHQCHNHSHSMKVFTHYDLLDSNGRKVAEGHKASFCLEDSSCQSGVQKVFDCEKGEQGISPGCEDTYKASIDCQWIDVTGVLQDEYRFRVLVNPNRLVPESNFENNGIECSVVIRRFDAKIWGCKLIGV